jgi:26S proteasome regulatory subunit N3
MLQAKDVATAAVQRLGSFNRRTLDVLAARVYHYYSLAHERTGTLPTIRR